MARFNDFPIITNPTGTPALYYKDGSAYDATAAEADPDLLNDGAITLIQQQSLGAQSTQAITNPLPTRIVNNTAITGGELP